MTDSVRKTNRGLMPVAILVILGIAMIPFAGSPAAAGSSAKGIAPPADGIVAYYFHGEFRCSTCRKLEALSRESIEEGFPEQLKSGELRFEVVNMETPETKHFVEDFQLTTKSLVLVEYKDGKVIRWQNLPKIWELVRNEAKFVRYVQGKTRAFLREG